MLTLFNIGTCGQWRSNRSPTSHSRCQTVGWGYPVHQAHTATNEIIMMFITDTRSERKKKPQYKHTNYIFTPAACTYRSSNNAGCQNGLNNTYTTVSEHQISQCKCFHHHNCSQTATNQNGQPRGPLH